MINASILTGTCVAAFVVGCLLTAAAAWMFVCHQMSSAQPLPLPGPAAPPVAATNVHAPQASPWWRPQPEGFDQLEHCMIVKLTREHIIGRTGMLQTLVQNLVSSTKGKWREPVPADTCLPFSASSDKFGYVPSNMVDWAILPRLFAHKHSRESGLSYLISHLVFFNIALTKKECGPPSWNLLSPHLASLVHEIERSRRVPGLQQDDWNLWALEKCRIYACESLYPDIFPTEVLTNEEQQPTTNPEALSKMVSFIEDLLQPYIFIDDDFRNELQRILTIAARLGVCIHKNMQPWVWSFNVPSNRILLFPGICEGGNESGIRYKVPKVILPAQVDENCDIHGNLL